MLPLPESAFRMTTSSLKKFFPGILASWVYLPENFTTSPGNNMGGGVPGGDEDEGNWIPEGPIAVGVLDPSWIKLS